MVSVTSLKLRIFLVDFLTFCIQFLLLLFFCFVFVLFFVFFLEEHQYSFT